MDLGVDPLFLWSRSAVAAGAETVWLKKSGEELFFLFGVAWSSAIYAFNLIVDKKTP